MIPHWQYYLSMFGRCGLTGGNMTLMVGTGSKNALPIDGLFLYFMIVVQEVSS